ncbi:MAG: hypothetical protein ACR2JJ_03745 [Sphingomicrobium sp.]
MRSAIVILALLLAACDAGPNWVNGQAELANELNPPAPAADESNALSDTDYVNETSAATNDINAVDAESPTDGNEATPPPATPE